MCTSYVINERAYPTITNFTLESKLLLTQQLLYIVKFSVPCYTRGMEHTGKHSCPITQVAELLSDTWTILIMRALTEGPKRFTELEAWLGNISSRTLTRKLERLQEEGMIVRAETGC